MSSGQSGTFVDCAHRHMTTAEQEIRALLKCLFGLHREAKGNFSCAVENLEHAITDQAMKLALGSWSRDKFDAAVAGVAFGADDIGLSHVREITTPDIAVLAGAGRQLSTQFEPSGVQTGHTPVIGCRSKKGKRVGKSLSQEGK